jgi:serine/threonine-protein kinase
MIFASVAVVVALLAAGGFALAASGGRDDAGSGTTAVAASPTSTSTSTVAPTPAQQAAARTITPPATQTQPVATPVGGAPAAGPASAQAAAPGAGAHPAPAGPAAPANPPAPQPQQQPPPDNRPAVPDVSGLLLSDAAARLKAAGFNNIPYLYECYGSQRISTVVRQVPRPGTRQAATSAVQLYLQAQDCSTVANVVGMTLDDAATTLKQIGFTNLPYYYECLGSSAIGRVVRQSPGGGTSYGRSKPISLHLQANNC